MTPAADPVAEFIASGGSITRCPVACAAPTVAELSAADRQRVGEHEAEREARIREGEELRRAVGRIILNPYGCDNRNLPKPR